jgi:hypothetical protein
MSTSHVFDNPHRASTSPARHQAHRERGERRHAIRTVLHHAHDAADAGEILAMLGLDVRLLTSDEDAHD